MGNPGGPFGGPYAGQGNQGLGGAGLGPQLQNKGPMAQFNVDKKNQPMQGMAAMVGNKYKLTEKMYYNYFYQVGRFKYQLKMIPLSLISSLLPFFPLHHCTALCSLFLFTYLNLVLIVN